MNEEESDIGHLTAEPSSSPLELFYIVDTVKWKTHSFHDKLLIISLVLLRCSSPPGHFFQPISPTKLDFYTELWKPKTKLHYFLSVHFSTAPPSSAIYWYIVP